MGGGKRLWVAGPSIPTTLNTSERQKISFLSIPWTILETFIARDNTERCCNRSDIIIVMTLGFTMAVGRLLYYLSHRIKSDGHCARRHGPALLNHWHSLKERNCDCGTPFRATRSHFVGPRMHSQ